MSDSPRDMPYGDLKCWRQTIGAQITNVCFFVIAYAQLRHVISAYVFVAQLI